MASSSDGGKDERIVLKINREQCHHAPERRTFDIYNRRTAVFSDFQCAFGTSACRLEVSLGPLDNGPWAVVNSTMLDTNIGDLMDEVLTNALWYITNQHAAINDRSRRESSVSAIPMEFDDFRGFNEHRRKKLKSQPLDSSQLKAHAETLFSLCDRPIMQTSSAWEQGYKVIKALAHSLWSYHEYLGKHYEQVEDSRNLDHPVRPLSEYASVITVFRTKSEVKPQYKLLDTALYAADYNEPVFFYENIHIETQFEYGMQRHRFLQNLQLSVTVDIIKYCPGGGIATTCCLFKVPDCRSDSEKQTSAVSNMLKVQSQFPEYHTRFMKRQFKQRLDNVASIQPAILDMIYKDLTLDATTVSHPDTQQRLRMIFMGEVGLLADLRKLNPGRPSGTFDIFFTKLNELVEEFTAADDRRHNEAHMSHILSLKDVIQQAKYRCPENTDIPSSSLVRLQFTPRNPYANTALSLSSKLPVQYKIQRRQLRISHPDEHFTNAQFKYLRSLAVRMGKACSLFCCDDKAKIPFGEPDVALSTGVRGKRTITPSTSTLVAADHDLHHKGCLTPSVYFSCDIPDSVDKSIYKGHVTTIINDSVLQSSNPIRHAASVVKLVKGVEDKPTVILKYTDGGTDHRNNLEQVKCASICMFKELDLDMYIAARCAPGHIWTNPAERVMSILNVGLQNCALSRTKGSEETEALLKKCGSMDAIRKAAADKPELKEVWEMSMHLCAQSLRNDSGDCL